MRVPSGARQNSISWSMGGARDVNERCGRLAADFGDELVAAAEHRADHRLAGPVVTDRPARRLDSAGERRLADEAIAPHVVEQLRLGDDPISVSDEVSEHVEDLPLDVHGLTGPFEPEALEVESEGTEGVAREANVPRSPTIATEFSRAATAGGRARRRSGDLPLFRRTLCRLSYSTVRRAAAVLSHSGGAAVPTGLEPATSGLTGRRELQTSPRDHGGYVHPQRDSNPCRHLERVVS